MRNNFVRQSLTYDRDGNSTEVGVDVDPCFFLEGFQTGIGDELGSCSVIETGQRIAFFDDG